MATTTGRQRNRGRRPAASPTMKMMFTWRPCPRHRFLGVSTIVTDDAAPWCVGDGRELAGHPVEPAQLAAPT